MTQCISSSLQCDACLRQHPHFSHSWHRAEVWHGVIRVQLCLAPDNNRSQDVGWVEFLLRLCGGSPLKFVLTVLGPRPLFPMLSVMGDFSWYRAPAFLARWHLHVTSPCSSGALNPVLQVFYFLFGEKRQKNSVFREHPCRTEARPMRIISLQCSVIMRVKPVYSWSSAPQTFTPGVGILRTIPEVHPPTALSSKNDPLCQSHPSGHRQGAPEQVIGSRDFTMWSYVPNFKKMFFKIFEHIS